MDEIEALKERREKLKSLNLSCNDSTIGDLIKNIDRIIDEAEPTIMTSELQDNGINIEFG